MLRKGGHKFKKEKDENQKKGRRKKGNLTGKGSRQFGFWSIYTYYYSVASP